MPTTAEETELAGAMIDMLSELGLRSAPEGWPLPPLQQSVGVAGADIGPIRLGPALMVYLDPLNRRAFRTEWENAMEQN